VGAGVQRCDGVDMVHTRCHDSGSDCSMQHCSGVISQQGKRYVIFVSATKRDLTTRNKLWMNISVTRY
jgi:hypothetical protein